MNQDPISTLILHNCESLSAFHGTMINCTTSNYFKQTKKVEHTVPECVLYENFRYLCAYDIRVNDEKVDVGNALRMKLTYDKLNENAVTIFE